MPSPNSDPCAEAFPVWIAAAGAVSTSYLALISAKLPGAERSTWCNSDLVYVTVSQRRFFYVTVCTERESEGHVKVLNLHILVGGVETLVYL